MATPEAKAAVATRALSAGWRTALSGTARLDGYEITAVGPLQNPPRRSPASSAAARQLARPELA